MFFHERFHIAQFIRMVLQHQKNGFHPRVFADANTPFFMATIGESYEPVAINMPSKDTLASHRRFKGEIQEFANKRLILITDEGIEVSAAITAQSKDLLFLGSVLTCQQKPDARWTIHVLVNRAMLVV